MIYVSCDRQETMYKTSVCVLFGQRRCPSETGHRPKLGGKVVFNSSLQFVFLPFNGPAIIGSKALVVGMKENSECVVYVVGPEGSGKSTLLLQLESLIVRRALLGTQELVVAPTTGQEIAALSVPPIPFMQSWLCSEFACETRAPTDAKCVTAGRENQTCIESFQSVVSSATSAKRVPQAPKEKHLAADALPVSLRELGGRMASSWQRFITTAATRHLIGGVVFVVDVSSSWQIPLAVGEFLSLVRGRSVCGPTKILLLINKCCTPEFEEEDAPPKRHARMTEVDVIEAFLRPLDGELSADISSRVGVVWADSWLGMGLLDVLLWLRRTAEGE